MRYEFVKAERKSFPTTLLCRLMKLSTSAFYQWLRSRPSKRDRENEVIRASISEAFISSRGTYGRRRIAATLQQSTNKPPSVNRVERRMKELKIAGYRPQSFKRTTVPDPLLEDSPNLLQEASSKGIDEIWVSDITYIATKQGWLYLCTIMDLFSRKIIGWSLKSHMKAELVLEAFEAAFAQRKPSGPTIFHSDKGGQYKSKIFRRRLARRGFRQSMTGVNHCYDNAHAESFFSTLKKDLIRGSVFDSRNQAEVAIFEYVEVFYNRFRAHSSLGNLSPEEFENIA